MKRNKDLGVEVTNYKHLLNEVGNAKSHLLDLTYLFHTTLGNIGFHTDLYLGGRELKASDYEEWQFKRNALERFIRKYNNQFISVTSDYEFKPSVKTLYQLYDHTSFDNEDEYREEMKKDIRILNKEFAELDDVLEQWSLELRSHLILKYGNIEFILESGQVKINKNISTVSLGGVSYKLLEALLSHNGKIEQSKLYEIVYKEKVDFYQKKHHQKLKSGISELRKKMDMYGTKGINANLIRYNKPFIELIKII